MPVTLTEFAGVAPDVTSAANQAAAAVAAANTAVTTANTAAAAVAGKADASTVTAAVTTANSAATTAGTAATNASTALSAAQAASTAVAAKADASTVTALATTVSSKADASTVTALATTVAGKADSSAVAAKADASTVTALATTVAGKQAALVSGTNIKRVNGQDLTGPGDVTITGGAESVGDLTDIDSFDLPNENAALAAALNNKATILAPVDLGTGAVTLLAASHANRPLKWHGSSPATATLSTTGAVEGDIIAIPNTGSAALTFGGAVDAGAGYSLVIPAGSLGAVYFSNGGWHSDIFAPTTSSFQMATVTGTGLEGSTMTCTPASGYAGTFQWTRDGANISGATSSTYVVQSADATHSVACAFTVTKYGTNGVTATAIVSATGYLVMLQGDENAAVNLSTDGFDDWYLARKTGDGSVLHKVTASVIPDPTLLNSIVRREFSNTSGGAFTVNSGDIAEGGGPITVSAWPGWQGSDNTGKVQFPIPADGNLHMVRIWFGDNVLVRVSMTGGDTTERVFRNHYGAAKTLDVYFRASSGGQTMTVSLECTSDDVFFGFAAIAYKANATELAGRTDTLTRADAVTLGVPSGGGTAWVPDPSGAGLDSQLKLVSNFAVQGTGNSGSWLDTNSPQQRVQVKITEAGAGYSWIYLGAYGANFARARIEYSHWDHTVQIHAGYNGSFGPLTSADACTLGAGNFDISLNGDQVTLKVNGTTVQTATITGNEAGRLEQQVGLRTDGGGKFSNLVVTPITA